MKNANNLKIEQLLLSSADPVVICSLTVSEENKIPQPFSIVSINSVARAQFDLNEVANCGNIDATEAANKPIFV